MTSDIGDYENSYILRSLEKLLAKKGNIYGIIGPQQEFWETRPRLTNLFLRYEEQIKIYQIDTMPKDFAVSDSAHVISQEGAYTPNHLAETYFQYRNADLAKNLRKSFFQALSSNGLYPEK